MAATYTLTDEEQRFVDKAIRRVQSAGGLHSEEGHALYGHIIHEEMPEEHKAECGNWHPQGDAIREAIYNKLDEIGEPKERDNSVSRVSISDIGKQEYRTPTSKPELDDRNIPVAFHFNPKSVTELRGLTTNEVEPAPEKGHSQSQ